MKRLVVELDEKLHAKAKSQAYAEETTLTEKVKSLLNKWLKLKG